jgi:hypothetical protein
MELLRKPREGARRLDRRIAAAIDTVTAAVATCPVNDCR